MSGAKSPDLKSLVAVLVVSSDEQDHHALRGILSGRCQCHRAGTRGETSSFLKRDCPRLVICDQVLPDGDWRDVLADLQKEEQAPLLIVVSRHPDERLWAEVLNLGGYDVLMKPFDHAEVSRVVNMATKKSNTATG